MNPPPDYGITAALDRASTDRQPLSQRTKRWGPTPARVDPAVRRRVVLRARIAIDYPTHLEPADIRHWLATALVAEAANLDVTIDLLQVALAAAPAWRTGGPPDLSAAIDADTPVGTGR